jgi:hypothetical protein
MAHRKRPVTMPTMPTARRTAIDLYLSPTGDDGWSGRLAAATADGRDGPLRSLPAAANAARRLRRSGARVRVVLRGGRYELADTWRLGAADGGTEAAPAVWMAHPGEQPVISGGRRITGWQAGSANGRDCWIADLPEVAAGSWWFSQLWVDGRRAERASLPKQGWWAFAAAPDMPGWTQRWYEGPDHMIYAPGTIDPAWRNIEDVELVSPELWFENHLRIAGVDPGSSTVRFRTRQIGRGIDETGKADRFRAVHVFEGLTQPGEWYLDRQLGRLFYLPRPGETMNEVEVVAPRLQTLVEVQGKRTAPVEHLHLIGLDLRHAEVAMPVDHPGAVQAAVQMPGAVRLLHARHCAMQDCAVSRISQYAVEIGHGCQDCRVAGCHLHDLGAGGVKVEHEWLIPKGVQGGCTPDDCDLWHARQVLPGFAVLPVVGKPPRTSLRQCATVEDNIIHDGCRVYRSAIGIWIGNCGGNRIRRNHLFDLGYTGISCGWTWSYADTATVDNRIEHNHIHHINWPAELSDNGAIYTLGRHPLGVIRGNHIHHVGCWGYGGSGIYLDEGSSEFLVEVNLVHHTTRDGLTIHYGRDNVVRGNCFAHAQHGHINLSRMEPHRTLWLEDNLLVWDTVGQPSQKAWSGMPVSAQRNLLWAGGRGIILGGQTLADWQAVGALRDCLIADPGFVAPEAGDFRLRAGSPALAMGLRSPGSAGPQGWRQRPEARVRTRLEVQDERNAILRIENIGETVASGRVRVRGCEGVHLAGESAFTVARLKPGASQRHLLRLTVDAGLATWWLETAVHGAGFMPTLQSQRRLLLAPRMDATEPALLPDLLDEVKATAWRLAGTSADTVRLACTSSHLAVEVRVADAAPTQGALAWQGSCVEVFVDPAEEPNPSWSARRDIRQVFLVPAVGSMPARAAVQDGGERPDAGILLDSTVDTAGWRLAALIPLSLLHVRPEQRRCSIEVVVSAHRQAGQPPLRSQLAGAPSPFASSLGYLPIVLG